ncbi:multiple epidermal growth factor-like domains protein 11 [Venturia canescens]|uniref:multiple epidermal growth factor-like domains protein 11 n=1 Tax=Venturia canescens TaxID=32260 RepID=UPI001C9CD318|nr:multiple epidermal growth factor-like domains protein 11 [Venturia canescens]
MKISDSVLGTCFLVLVMFSTLPTEISGDALGQCRILESQQRTRMVSYRETYRKRVLGIFWKRATRINFRREVFTDLVWVTSCCDGYHRVREVPITCEPECYGGCQNGHCIEPNTCLCFPGHRHPSLEDLNTCVPDCDGNANHFENCGEHGRCIAPMRCECDDGYMATFAQTNAIICEPKCEPACGLHGFCYEPNKCRCETGYRLALINVRISTFEECEPICENLCINGVCQAPNKCSCLPGYKQHPTKYFLCEPVCNYDCINANCTKPDHCECHVGYEKSQSNPLGTCSPICDPKCINGVCTHPNHCECHQGYGIRPNDSNNSCTPICNVPCINAACTQPDTCECYPGYGKNRNGPHNECSPLCDPPCINGECTKPNHCECNHRYKTDSNHPEVCLPICDPPCTNAVCIQPDTCKCLVGYKQSMEEQPQMCSPICDSPCINGYCHKPNLCHCNNGYKNLPTDPPQFCTPVCDPACDSNGFCESPNKCRCNKGYIEADSVANSTFKNSVICQPFCSSKCNENASCIAPDLCQCNLGYQPVFPSDQQVSNPTQCLPICEKDCIDGFCGYPNECVCFSGYKISENDKFKCEPHCQRDCINAKCTGPNHCECLDGYEKAPLRPSEPGDNLSILDNICIPRCSENCSSCVAPNQCICHPGYVLKNSVTNPSSQSCQPLCEPACPKGLECVLPNQCEVATMYNQTDNGFLKTEIDVYNSTQDCPDSGNFSIKQGSCICKTGWSGSRCDEPNFCVATFTANNETDNQFYTMLSEPTENHQINNETANEEAARMRGWKAPKCNEDCQKSVMEFDFNNISDLIIHCHREIVPDVVSDSFVAEEPSQEAETNNSIIVCFIKAESKCSIPKTRVSSAHGSLSTVSGVVGSGVFVITLTLVGSIIFIVFRKRKNTLATYAVSRSTSILAEWADDPNHNSNPETSTL